MYTGICAVIYHKGTEHGCPCIDTHQEVIEYGRPCIITQQEVTKQ